MLDDEETREHLKQHCRHGEEVKWHNCFAMIMQEGKPLLARIIAVPVAPEVSSHASFGDNKAELLQLAIDPGSSPTRLMAR